MMNYAITFFANVFHAINFYSPYQANGHYHGLPHQKVSHWVHSLTYVLRLANWIHHNGISLCIK
jgi:hypothetical protein